MSVRYPGLPTAELDDAFLLLQERLMRVSGIAATGGATRRTKRALSLSRRRLRQLNRATRRIGQ